MGYFLIMIIFMVIAIVRAKDGKPWIWYGIGVGLQLVSMIGLTRRYSVYGMGGVTSGTWIVFFVIAIVSAIIISIRKSGW